MTTTQPADQPRKGVVVHLDDAAPAVHAAVLRNLANAMDELGPDVDYEVVVHGPGLAAVTGESASLATVVDLISRGAVIAACANTMRSQQLTEADLIAGVTVVPAGVAELVRKQWAGWAYVRP